MKYELDWTFLAEKSYFEEIEFIFLKWNEKEVFKFEDLVNEELQRLVQNPTIGKIKNNYYSIMISKQTTLYYMVNKKQRSIVLLLFWNNSKNPTDLSKLL